MNTPCPTACAHILRLPTGAECDLFHTRLAPIPVRLEGCTVAAPADQAPPRPICPVGCKSLKSGFSMAYCTERGTPLEAAAPTAVRHATCTKGDPAFVGPLLLPHATTMEDTGMRLDYACGDLRQALTGSRGEDRDITDDAAGALYLALTLARDANYLAARLVRQYAAS